MTCLPFPFPSSAPSIIPGKYNNCNLLLHYRKNPDKCIKVVNYLSWTSDICQLMCLNNVFFYIEGKSVRPARVSPDFMASKISPLAPPEHIIVKAEIVHKFLLRLKFLGSVLI